MSLYISITLVTLIYFIYCYVTNKLNYWKDRNVAGPTPIPLFGNLKEYALRRKTVSDVYKELYMEFPNEKVIGIYRMLTPSLLIRDLDVIKSIMIKDFNNFIDRGMEKSTKGLGGHLINAKSEAWQILRSKFTPLFTSVRLKNMFHLINERGDKFVDYIKKTIRNEPEQEVHELVKKYTVSTISACAFGLDIDMEKDLKELKMMNKLSASATIFRAIAMVFPGVFKNYGHLLFPKQVTDFFYGLVRTVVSQRNGQPSNRKDFMDLILQMRQEKEIHGIKRGDHSSISLELTEDIIAAQAFIFYTAGFETSAGTMGYMLHSLAVNPDIQDKLIAEIDDVLRRYNGELTYESLKEMRYMTQVFDETLRMYPVVDLQRKAKTDYPIPGTDVIVKKGELVFISPLGIHYDEKYYPNPNKFDPDRFSPENSQNRHPCAYLPFGVGPRNCIGMRFAEVQSRVCIAKILANFRVEPTRNTQKCIEFDPRKSFNSALGGIRLNIVPRKTSN